MKQFSAKLKEMESTWIDFKSNGWITDHFDAYHIDTRDFCIACRNRKEDFTFDLEVLSKYEHFFFTAEEVETLAERLYIESGGKGKWRMMDLVSGDDHVLNWNLKYLRIYKTYKGFVVCNSQDYALKKSILEAPVNQKYLCHQ